MKKKIISVISIVLALMTMMSVFSATIASAAETITTDERPVINSISATIDTVTLEFEYDDSDFQTLVYRKEAKSGAKWGRIAVLPAGVDSYKDKKVAPGKTYYYTVKAYYKAKDGTQYISKSAGDYKVTTTLAKPEFSLISNMGKGVVMQWKQRSDATGFVIYRSTTGKTGSYKAIATIKSNKAGQYIDTKVNIGSTYYYCFKAYKTISGVSYYSSASKVHKKIISDVSAPQNFKVVVMEDGIHISYDKVPGVLGYSIYRREVGAKKWDKIAQPTSVNKLSFVDTTAETGKTYQYTVKSYKTVNGKTKSSTSAPYTKVINLVITPKIEIEPTEISFKDYYETIPVTIKLKDFEKGDGVKIFIDKTEITEELVKDEKAYKEFLAKSAFTYVVDEKESDEDEIVINLVRLVPGEGTLKVVHKKYSEIYTEVAVKCPELQYDTDYKDAVNNALAGVEGVENAKILLEEARDKEDVRETQVKSAVIVLTGAKSSLENSKLILIKYEAAYKKYPAFKSDLDYVEDYLDAVNDALKDLDKDVVDELNIKNAIRELDISEDHEFQS